MSRSWAIPLVLCAALLLSPPARAQTTADQAATGSTAALQTPAQIQSMISAGQTGPAIQALDNILAVHTKSGVAWYLLAEAYDAQNDANDAGAALNMAARCSPGLPFADKQRLAAMQAHIAAAQPAAVSGGHAAIYVIGGFLLLMVLLRFLPNRQPRAIYETPPPAPPGTPPYGFGYGPASGGGGFGSALLGGLAAGAGFAAGERIIDNMTSPNANLPPGADPSRDNGLLGNPGWDGTGTPSDDDLSNTGWS